jgi:hypothetical protein
MNILDVKAMLDIDRYRKIDISATQPSEVYADANGMAPENNGKFLVECARMLPCVVFADRDTGRIYASIEKGRLAWTDSEILRAVLDDPESRAGLVAVAPDVLARLGQARDGPAQYLEADRFQTLGRWGERRPALEASARMSA